MSGAPGRQRHWRLSSTGTAVKLLLATGAAAGLVAAGAAGTRAWNRATARSVAQVVSAASDRGGVFEPAILEGLPAPVVRYFEFALTPGQPLIRAARVEHAGEFRTALDARWSPFRSTQHFSAEPPGFVWDARIAMIPVVGVRVRDRYLGGSAGMLGKIGALIPVVDQAGGRELASSALHRYLAESVWLPTALLPREDLVWEPLTDSSARVTLSDAGLSVSLDVHFGDAGEIVRVEGDRYRDVEGVGVRTPFVGHFRDYFASDGMRIPRRGEVAWILAEGTFAYWRGRATAVAYTF
ncbi:MAG: DUF6544 family protein [Gemmatimonadota bacterium]